MKFGKLKESNNKQKTNLAISNSAICAGRIRLHDGKRVEATISGAAISNEVRQVLEKRDEIKREIKEFCMFQK